MELINTFNSLDAQSDKGTIHDYINGYYDQEFSNKKYENIKLLEIGVGQAHSLYLWKNFFINGQILGLENNPNLMYQFINPECVTWIDNDSSNVKIKFCDAYSNECVDQFNTNEFDYIIDDGPHTLESQIIFVQKYIDKVKVGGKLIIEDIQSDNELNHLIDLSKSMKLEYNAFDLRPNKGRYDDIILEIIKN